MTHVYVYKAATSESDLEIFGSFSCLSRYHPPTILILAVAFHVEYPTESF